MSSKASNQRCVLIIIADGFDEMETITWLTTLRQASLWVKSVGLTSGLISGAYGIGLMPDLSFAELNPLLEATAVNLVILPKGKQSLSRLEADPRVHKLLRQVVEQRGQIITTSESLSLLKVVLRVNEFGELDNDQKAAVLLYNPAASLETFAQNLIRKLLLSSQV
ncbi:MAG: DJ-1/PfpI family protein [Anaerolineaceae bacterium]|nr:DJ-1/PfpI family protein [Anaerolineaceae bacterium]